jgi:hypothetical protein
MIHFCADELIALASTVPFAGVLLLKARLWWRKRWSR